MAPSTKEEENNLADIIAVKMNTRYRNHLQPPYTRRLQQIENFLADEDIHRCMHFVRKFAEIELYVLHLERNEKALIGPRNLVKLLGIKQMIEIQRKWIVDATQIPPVTFSFATYQGTTRLESLEKIAELKKIYKDTPQTIPGPRGLMREVALALPIPLEDRPTELDPFLYTKALAALRLKQDNLAEQFRAEQRLLRGSDTAYIPAPANFNGPFLRIPKSEVEQNLAERHDYLLSIVSTLLDTELKAPRALIRDVLLQVQEGMSTSMASHATPKVDDSQTSLVQEEIDRLLVLSESSWHIMGDSMNFDRQAIFQELQPDGNDHHPRGTYDRLISFAKQTEESFGDETLWPANWGHISTESLARHLNLGRNAADGTTAYTTDECRIYLDCMARAFRVYYSRTTEEVGRIPPNAHPEKRFVEFLAPGDTTIQYNGIGLIGEPILLPQSQFGEIALKLGLEIRHVAERLAHDGISSGEQSPAAAAQEAYINAKISPKESLLGIAGSLAKPDDRPLTEARAAELLQAKVIEESNRNWDERRAPKWPRLWAFANNKPKATYFSLDRWPLELQTKERQDTIRNTALKPATAPENLNKRKKEKVDDLLAARQGIDAKMIKDWRNREKWYRGEATFPFGETPWQQAWLSHEIDNDLKESKSPCTNKSLYRRGIIVQTQKCIELTCALLAKAFKHLYEGRRTGAIAPTPETQFALPELPRDWTTENFWPQNGAWSKIAEIEAVRERHSGLKACYCGYNAPDIVPQIDTTKVPYGLVESNLDRNKGSLDDVRNVAEGTGKKRYAEEDGVEGGRSKKRAKGNKNDKNLGIDTNI
jgi:hypothetical protein